MATNKSTDSFSFLVGEPDTGLPNMAGPIKEAVNTTDYHVRVQKFNLNVSEDVILLEKIITTSFNTKDILLIERDKFTFNESYFVVLTYLEKN